MFFNDFNSTSDGFILSVSGGVFTNSPSPVLVRFDSTGRVLWQRSYGPSGSNISGVMQTEGGFIAVGQYYSERSSDASSWIFSVDSEGNPR